MSPLTLFAKTIRTSTFAKILGFGLIFWNLGESDANDPIPEGAKAGEVREFAADMKIKFCWCPAGEFRMGFPKCSDRLLGNQSPVDVTISKGFWMGQTEVTQRVWTGVMNTAPWTNMTSPFLIPGVMIGDKFPAAFISHGMDSKGNVAPDSASDFTQKLSMRERSAERLPDGWVFTLPTEAQWEYACRAGSMTKFCYGDDPSQLKEYAWYGAFAKGGSAQNEVYGHEVASKKPNAWNIHDMHGNLTEWCRDFHAEKLPGGVDPFVPQSQYGERAIRGGTFGATFVTSESSARGGVKPSFSACTVGFRIVLTRE